VARGVRLIIIPASRTEYQKALKTGLMDIFTDSWRARRGPVLRTVYGWVIWDIGSRRGGSKHFKTETSSEDREVLRLQCTSVSPATAAASAIDGVITDPSRIRGGT